MSGAKKLFSLTRTKIRLAEEAGTVECRPHPLPLVKRISGIDVSTIEDAKAYREDLLKNTSFQDGSSLSSSVLQCMDIIEGVKYLYEPPKYVSNIDAARMRLIEDQAKEKELSVNLLLMSEAAPEGVNLYIGEKQPAGTIYLSGVPTSIASFLEYAFGSTYFSSGGRLRNVRCVLGHRTLIINAIYHALGEYGASLSEEL